MSRIVLQLRYIQPVKKIKRTDFLLLFQSLKILISIMYFVHVIEAWRRIIWNCFFSNSKKFILLYNPLSSFFFTDLGKEFEEEPESISVHLGDVAMFACHIEGAPKPHVRWYKDEMEINTEHVNYR